MSSETYGKQTISTRKAKKIKLSQEKNIMNQVDNYPQKIEDLEWINHEIIIDDVMIEESSMNDTLESDNTNKIKRIMFQLALPPLQSENDNSFSNSKGAETNSITLRQDLYPDESEENFFIDTIIPAEMTQSKPVKTCSLELTLPQKDDSKAVTNSKGKSISINIDSTTDSEISEKSSISKFPFVLKKVDPKKVPLKIKEARNLLKSNMNLTATCKINQVVLKDTHSSKNVESERVSTGAKKSSNITRTDKNLVIVKQKLKEHFGKTSKRHKPYSPNNKKKKGIELKINDEVSNEPIIESNSQEEVIDSARKLNLDQLEPGVRNMLQNYPKSESKSEESILMMKVESSHVPEEIKKSLLTQKINNISCPHQNASQINISNNMILETDTSEVRLSSLANATQAVGRTTKTFTVLRQDVMKPSTSNNVELTHDLNTDSTFADYTNDMSNDEDSDEELGLNSLEELQQYWEFLVDLHDYNKQVIKSLQNRKRRYLLRINKLEHHLKHDLGIQFDESEEEEVEELSTMEVEQRTEEENLVVEKENRPTEE